jgi:type I restriction enzyme, S subunit
MQFKKLPIKEICKIIGGQPAPKGEGAFFMEGVPFVRMKDLGRYHLTNNLIEVQDCLSVDYLKRSRVNIIKKGSILLPRSGSVALNHRAILGRDAVIVSHICALEVIDERIINNSYLYYYLQTINMASITKMTTGLDAITFEDLAKIKIPIPPLPDQQRIASILDHADIIRKKNRQILQKYDELAQSVFYEMFGDMTSNEKDWKVVKLHSVCTQIIDCPHSTPKHQNIPTDFPCIRTSEIKEGKIDWGSMLYLNYENYLERIKRIKPLPGDIVYGREGSFGDAAIIPESINLALGQRVMLFRVDGSIINNVFFWAQIRSSFVLRQAQKLNCGATVGHVNIKDIRNFDLRLPPLEIQNQFAEITKEINKQVDLAVKSFQKSEDLFQSLLQRAFKGEL